MVILHFPPPTHQIVCIDPGHPSEVGRGTSGRHLTEIHVAWMIAKLLKHDLQMAGVDVVLTKAREEDFVTNRKRAETANRAGADLMVRLHCDAANGTGFTTYFPERQGHVGSFRGPSADLLKRERPLAESFHTVLTRSLRGFLRDNGLHGDEDTAVGRGQGALTGSIFSRVPVVLVEMVVLTNPKDEAVVATAPGRRRIADSLALATLSALRSMHRSATSQ